MTQKEYTEHKMIVYSNVQNINHYRFKKLLTCPMKNKNKNQKQVTKETEDLFVSRNQPAKFTPRLFVLPT